MPIAEARAWSLRRTGLVFGALLVATGASRPADAMEFTVKPPLILAQGKIRNGDELEFRNLLKNRPKGEIRAVVLHSGGGFVHAAGEIGREIRENGLFTVVDARWAACSSACTILFAAGTRRFYLNAEGVTDGAATKAGRGLSFHEGSSSSSRDANHYSGSGTAQVISYLYEFGVPGAAGLPTKAPPDSAYMVSARHALEIGLATDLGGPAGQGAPRKKARH